MSLTAEVVVLKNSRAVDMVFDYAVPQKFLSSVSVGSRVIVPFGRGNSESEGYVLNLKSLGKEEFELKNIKEVFPKPFFDEKGAQLIKYLKRKTMCTYTEAIHLLIPAGYGAKFKEKFFLNTEADVSKYEVMPLYKRIIDMCRLGCTFEKIVEAAGENSESAVKYLLKEDVLTRKKKTKEKLLKKTRNILKICDCDLAQKALKELPKNAVSQKNIIFYLLANGMCAPSTEVYKNTNATASAAAALAKKGIIEIEQQRIWRNPINEENFKEECDFELNDEQKCAYDKICDAIEHGKHEKFLMHGVTGAGKTEVFIRAVRKCTELNKTAIVLVPEISLTPLMTKRFVKRFGKSVAVLHSRLSAGERLDEWERIKSGEAKVVLGARSAVFAPIKNIGAIIIDEEHEQSYKSDHSPRYHARDIAFFRAEQYGAAVVMASATPLVESYYKALNGEYTLLELKKRANKKSLPEMFVVDMRNELEEGNRSMFSNRLANELMYNKENEEQTILLLNRRGFSTFVSCRECGFVATCPHCNISLTYHKNTGYLTCHYCGYSIKNYKLCPKCGSKYIKYFGAGTQKLEEEMCERFENMKTLRMDVDSTSKKNAHEKIINAFEKGEADVLMGTQMVSKGLDFPKVTLVGVMAADSSLYIDDYRSCERTFALLEQVSGRAGRAEMPGRAVIQTYSPDNSAIVYASKHDYAGFYNEEIKMRKLMYYPPFCQIGSVLISGKDKDEVKALITRIAAFLKKRMSNRKDVIILGPGESAIGKIMDKYRYRILIKYQGEIDDVMHEIQNGFQKGGYSEKMTLSLDINPVNLS